MNCPTKIYFYQLHCCPAKLSLFYELTFKIIQDEPLNLPEPVDQLLSDYAQRFSEIKTPRKLQWKKNLGTVKLELQFEDRVMQFTVAPVLASIIMKFQDQTSWTSKNLAAAIGIPVDVLIRRIIFWISKGVIAESTGADSSDHVYTILENMAETSNNGGSSNALELLGDDEEEDKSGASVENQLRKEMTVYEKFILGMLKNIGSMTLDRIHNMLKMLCNADKPLQQLQLQQLQIFLYGLVSEEKLELHDGMYIVKELK